MSPLTFHLIMHGGWSSSHWDSEKPWWSPAPPVDFLLSRTGWKSNLRTCPSSSVDICRSVYKPQTMFLLTLIRAQALVIIVLTFSGQNLRSREVNRLVQHHTIQRKKILGSSIY